MAAQAVGGFGGGGGAKFKHSGDSAARDLLARPAFAGDPPDMILARAHSTRLLPWQPKSHRFPQSALVRQSLRGDSFWNKGNADAVGSGQG